MNPINRLLICTMAVVATALAGFNGIAGGVEAYQYQLYKNSENFGILIFPKDNIYKELDDYILSLGFQPAESGKAIMRYGPKRLNQTYMMPPEVQEKHGIEKFIILQALADRRLLVGIFHPDWELTLPPTLYLLDEIKENIVKTLEVFRGNGSGKKAIRYGTGSGIQIHPESCSI